MSRYSDYINSAIPQPGNVLLQIPPGTVNHNNYTLFLWFQTNDTGLLAFNWDILEAEMRNNRITLQRGQISDIRIYDYAMSEEQIRDIMGSTMQQITSQNQQSLLSSSPNSHHHIGLTIQNNDRRTYVASRALDNDRAIPTPIHHYPLHEIDKLASSIGASPEEKSLQREKEWIPIKPLLTDIFGGLDANIH